jgi:low affinity Fe/Cu permease
MARKRTKPAAVPADAAVAGVTTGAPYAGPAGAKQDHHWSETFSRVACTTAHWMGKPIAFLVAAALVILWAATGPLFHYSDTWQLVINTSTTIVTFLMVFLIQNTQNRDALAIQIKLSELIIAAKGAPNRIALIDQLSDKELEKLQQECHEHAERHHQHAKLVESVLERRRKDKQKSKA